MKNITDYLIEEASAEEDELLGMGDNDEAKEGGEGCILERDEALIKVSILQSPHLNNFPHVSINQHNTFMH